jgi:hypothetical protein
VIDSNRTDGGVPIEVPIGGMVQPDSTGSLQVHVIVRAAPWVQVDSVQYLLGQVAVQPAIYERYLDPRAADVPCDGFHPCLSASSTALVRVDQTFTIPSQMLNATTDYWIAVRATGTKTLWPVVSLVTPYALANPVFIDGNRDGVWGRQGRQTGTGRAAHATPSRASSPRQADTEGDLARFQAALGAALQRSRQQ